MQLPFPQLPFYIDASVAQKQSQDSIRRSHHALEVLNPLAHELFLRRQLPPRALTTHDLDRLAERIDGLVELLRLTPAENAADDLAQLGLGFVADLARALLVDLPNRAPTEQAVQRDRHVGGADVEVLRELR